MQQEIQQWTKILLIIERVLHGMEIQIVVIFSCGILQRMDRFKLFSTVLSVMYLLQFIAGGISILKEKKGEKDNAHY